MSGKELLDFLNSLGENIKYVNFIPVTKDHVTWKEITGNLSIMITN